MLKRDVLSQSFRFTHDMLIQNVYKCMQSALKLSQQRASDYMESIVVVVGYRI